jgi:formamidopyrimidine-DNA glycosylase
VPELPEVETLRRDLQKTLVGRAFASVDVRLAKQVVAPTGLSIADLIDASKPCAGVPSS